MEEVNHDKGRILERSERTPAENYNHRLQTLVLSTPQLKNPRSYKEAMRAPDAAEWQRACDQELTMMKERNVWELVPRPKDRSVQVIHCGWVLTTKFSDTGVPIKRKARLVARGNEQTEVPETYAEVVSTDMVLLSLAIAVIYKWDVVQLDVKSAFLYGEMVEPIYMEQPEGTVREPGKICKVTKSIYGLRQAPRLWFHKLSQVVLNLDFVHVSEAPGMFFRIRDNVQTLIVVYVDDILVLSPSAKETKQVKEDLCKSLDLTDSGHPESYLSLTIKKTERSFDLQFT